MIMGRRMRGMTAAVSMAGMVLAGLGAGGTPVAHGAAARAAMQAPSTCTTPASQNMGGFAIDGFLQRQCPDTQDWANGPGGTGVVQGVRNSDGTCTSQASTGVLICDGVKQADQSVFGGGNKEDNPCAWSISPAPPPPPGKDDIANAYVAGSGRHGGGPVYIYTGVEYVGRQNNPSTNYDIELNKSTTNGIPNRQAGDVLLSVDFNGYNAPYTIKMWVAKTPAQDPNVQPCGTQTANYDFANPDYTAQGTGGVSVGPNVIAAVNTTDIACGSWQCYTDKYDLTNTLPAYNFAEAGFNLTNILLNAGVDPCNSVDVSFRSRASGSSTMAQLKDAVGPQSVIPCSSHPTAARITAFSATRHSGTVSFSWHAGVRSGIAGFNLYGGSHRLNTHVIPAHAAPGYHYTAHFTGKGPFSLHVVLQSGRQLTVHA